LSPIMAHDAQGQAENLNQSALFRVPPERWGDTPDVPAFYSRNRKPFASREKRLYARIAQALEEYPLTDFRFLTVTTAPWSKQRNRIEKLRLAWKELIRRLRRRYGTVEYVAVVEWNARRDLMHIHALIRSPFIPQRIISEEWEKITGARVTFITSLYLRHETENGGVELRRDFDVMTESARRRVVTKVSAYMSKYLSKQSGEHVQKRTWVSRNWSERWKTKRRLDRIGRDLDTKVGPGRFWQDRKLEQQRRESIVWRKVQKAIGDELGFLVQGFAVVPVLKWQADSIDWNAFLAVEWRKGFWLRRLDRFRAGGEVVSDEPARQGWTEDESFWRDLVGYLETVDLRAPPA